MTGRIEHMTLPNNVRTTEVGPYYVATVRLWRHKGQAGFQMMVIDRSEVEKHPLAWNELDSEHYETWEQALAGHEKAVSKWQKKADSVLAEA